jgi:F-type H+-transporting ATPase subunit gamma
MPALVDIRRRIRTVKNTQQITKALKMVSAAKLRRAQEAMFAARPYARKLSEVLQGIATRGAAEAHPLLRERPEKRVAVIVVTADKGLAGGFNANIIRRANAFLSEHKDHEVSVVAVGRKGRDSLRRRKAALRSEHIGAFQTLRFQTAQEIAAQTVAAYAAEELDAVYLIFNEFKSVIAQRIVVERLLPIPKLEQPAQAPLVEYLYEPRAADIYSALLPKYVEINIWRALLESAAAEHGARMAAMDSATKNASETIDKLTLYMNKVRQAAITREIIEVVSGASS